MQQLPYQCRTNQSIRQRTALTLVKRNNWCRCIRNPKSGCSCNRWKTTCRWPVPSVNLPCRRMDLGRKEVRKILRQGKRTISIPGGRLCQRRNVPRTLPGTVSQPRLPEEPQDSFSPGFCLNCYGEFWISCEHWRWLLTCSITNLELVTLYREVVQLAILITLRLA